MKQICCRVAPSDRRAFSHGQRAWRGLAGCPGLRGQTGGWALDEADFAVILRLWQEQPAKDGFQAQRPEPLYEGSGPSALIQTNGVRVRRAV
ncbi:MAG: DUF4937 domain-containing protein, partial [Planctomycetes bacterium]|nr:DUF4937 domain-containing protein [Planctomycetota bacterium]